MIERLNRFLSQFNRDLWILAAGWFVAALGFAASIPFIALYLHDRLAMSATEIGGFFGALAVVRSVFQAIGGELSDHIARRWLLVHSQWIRGITFVFMALAVSYHWGFWGIAACMVVNSIFGAVFMPAVNAMVADILPPEQRLDGFAITRAAGNLGWAAGPAIGGFLAAGSYATLFYVSAAITLLSAAVFWAFMRTPRRSGAARAFRFSDLLELRRDHNLAIHAMLLLSLYLVVGQLMMTFSVYTVDMVGISKVQLGWLYALNGLMVVLLQVPVTHRLRHLSFTTQLAIGSFLYFVGYGSLGLLVGFEWFVLAIVVVTSGEIIMSPPSLTLTSRLAPEGRSGRYMGIYGFCSTAGWSLGPLLGGIVLDRLGDSPALAWLSLSSLAIVSGVGYLWFGRRLPAQYDT